DQADSHLVVGAEDRRDVLARRQFATHLVPGPGGPVALPDRRYGDARLLEGPLPGATAQLRRLRVLRPGDVVDAPVSQLEQVARGVPATLHLVGRHGGV